MPLISCPTNQHHKPNTTNREGVEVNQRVIGAAYVLIGFRQHVDTLLHHIACFILAHVLQGFFLEPFLNRWGDTEATIMISIESSPVRIALLQEYEESNETDNYGLDDQNVSRDVESGHVCVLS